MIRWFLNASSSRSPVNINTRSIAVHLRISTSGYQVQHVNGNELWQSEWSMARLRYWRRYSDTSSYNSTATNLHYGDFTHWKFTRKLLPIQPRPIQASQITGSIEPEPCALENAWVYWSVIISQMLTKTGQEIFEQSSVNHLPFTLLFPATLSLDERRVYGPQ